MSIQQSVNQLLTTTSLVAGIGAARAETDFKSALESNKPIRGMSRALEKEAGIDATDVAEQQNAEAQADRQLFDTINSKHGALGKIRGYKEAKQALEVNQTKEQESYQDYLASSIAKRQQAIQRMQTQGQASVQQRNDINNLHEQLRSAKYPVGGNR